jgi:mono/diheme cytochrome c family protein
VQCHDLRAITSQRKTEAAWRRTVNEMIWRGAPLMPGEVDVVTRYLASMANREPRTTNRETDPFAKQLPPGPGRALVVGACVQCHDLATTVNQRKTPEAWRRSVEQMAHLGARLNGREIQVVAQYLAKAFRE